MRCGGTTFVAMCEKMPMVAPGDGCRCRAFMTLTCFVVARGQPTHEPRRHCRRLVSSPACLVCKDFPPSGPARCQPGAAIRPPVDDVRSSSWRWCSYSYDVWNIQEVHPGVVVQVRRGLLPSGAAPLGQCPHHGQPATTTLRRGGTHATWEVLPDRPDPIALLEEQGHTRVPEPVPTVDMRRETLGAAP